MQETESEVLSDLQDRVNGLQNVVYALTAQIGEILKRLDEADEPEFIPIKKVVADKLLPKAERTLRDWVKKGREGYHYRYCGKTLLLEVNRFKDLLNGIDKSK